MPVTNRDALAMPGRPDPTGRGGSGEYFKGLRPVPPLLETGLAIFAVFIILRYCVRQLTTLLKSRRREQEQPGFGQQRQPPQHYRFPPSTPKGTGLKGSPPWYRDNWQPKYLPPPPAFSIDEKRGMMSRDAGEPPREGFSDVESAEGVAPSYPYRGPSVDTAAAARHFIIPRPPPAPPLTPPGLRSGFNVRGVPSPVSDAFMHQPNPDYTSSSGASQSSSQQTSATSHSAARRRSYHRPAVPVGIPPLRYPITTEADGPQLVSAPRSYPSGGPYLPPDPASLFAGDVNPAAAGGGAPAGGESGGGGVDVRGEVVSVLDDAGAGWTRHTRVYGGGVCLACAAAGQEHGRGGYYGATVTPEEMW